MFKIFKLNTLWINIIMINWVLSFIGLCSNSFVLYGWFIVSTLVLINHQKQVVFPPDWDEEFISDDSQEL